MSEINDLQNRLAVALDAIGAALDAPPKEPAADPLLTIALKDQLEEERMLNQQLEERIKALHAKEAEVAAAHQIELDALRTDLQQARDANRSNRAEIDAILADLRPMLSEGQNA